ncbi:MAG TPA: DUF885 domain-containing protein [Jatrophihabitantaceae bacterium]|nr:DUF885 domain-containing protein [Jatrophihabitantaceae bacterium]
MTETRIPTDVDRVADTYLDTWAVHDPMMATYFGVAGHDHQLPELSPDWYEERSGLRRRTLAALAAARPTDANDRITVAALGEALEIGEEIRATGAEEADLKNIASPLQTIRDTFDLTPTATVDDWATLARRLSAVGPSVDGYIASLRLGGARGNVSPRRQVLAGIAQCDDVVGPHGFFAAFARGARPDSGDALPAAVHSDLDRGAAAASDAYARLQTYLREELLPLAPERDAIGRELYTLHSRSFLGSQVDLEETYAWGQEELARITAEMERTAERITPGASVREAMAHLDADPARRLQGTDALQAWMQEKSDAAVSALTGTHFDIPDPIRRLECRIAPTHTGGIYYTQPSEDLTTRPGRMWWSVPSGVTEFSTWGELTTVYHEGVPGHHLQVAQTIYRRALLNRWRRIASWVSGHGEGWALYAERLMADLGYLDDPGDYLGMLDAQSMRAARVVLDIGIHCDFEAPAEVGGGEWDYDRAWRFFTAHCSRDDAFLRFELERYLGWPGQAPSYKIGERMWLQLREDARAEQGDAFDLKGFHRSALDIGSVGLDVLRSAVLGEFG